LFCFVITRCDEKKVFEWENNDIALIGFEKKVLKQLKNISNICIQIIDLINFLLSFILGSHGSVDK